MDYNQNGNGPEWPNEQYPQAGGTPPYQQPGGTPPYQQPGGMPPYQPYPPQYQPANSQVILREVGQRKENKLGITALVLGIVTLVFCWAPFISVITGIIGMIMSIISLVKEEGKVMPIIGMILSILGLAAASLVILVYIMELTGYAY